MINIKNLSIILTGATGGIGNAILDKLVEGGANVLATGTNENKLDLIKQKYKNVKAEKFDQSNHDKIEKFVDKSYETLDNKIDILINNAGITKDNLAIRMKDEEWKKVIDTNLTSTFLLSKFVIKKMLKQRNGKILNISSVVGHTGNIGQANYAASKAGIIAMSKSLAIEYGKKNIKVNSISPGFIKSQMTDKLNDEHKDSLMSNISLGRFGEPTDIANTVVFLCSDLSDYITGETIHVNGGMYFS